MSSRWSVLLSPQRLYTAQSARPPADERSEFERDYDRLIFASPFRRLQDKAQVFPLEHNDFVRTRLTHSLEVSTLGRSLGRQVAARIAREKGEALQPEEVGTIVATTCLAHDIGNPPFGHFGESVIQAWFRDFFAQHPEVAGRLTSAQQNDFLRYDGNAQGLRILTFLQSLGYDNGLNLTAATLASFMKYVVPSDRVQKEPKSHSKIGYFQSEANKVQRVRALVGLGETRHPLVYLMEAADDIAYSVVDVEDAFKKRVLPSEAFVTALEEALLHAEQRWVVDKFKKNLVDAKVSREERLSSAIQWFRINAIGIMFQAVVEQFMGDYDAILDGSLEAELMERSRASQLHGLLKRMGRDHIYCAPEILKLEVFGDRVIRGLLERFVPACLSENRKLNSLDGKLYALMSPSMRHLQERHTQLTPYDRLQLALDHICGMTDTYAVMVYEQLTGRQ